MSDRYNANLDPFQDLVDLQIEITMLKHDKQQLETVHNNLARRYQLLEVEVKKLRRWQQDMQVRLAQISHYVGYPD